LTNNVTEPERKPEVDDKSVPKAETGEGEEEREVDGEAEYEEYEESENEVRGSSSNRFQNKVIFKPIGFRSNPS